MKLPAITTIRVHSASVSLRSCIVAQRALYTDATSSPTSSPQAERGQAAATNENQNVEASSMRIGSTPSLENTTKMPGVQRGKTVAELDEELRLKMEGMSGEGGSAGVEYENGKSEGLKRGVKANMFRVI